MRAEDVKTEEDCAAVIAERVAAGQSAAAAWVACLDAVAWPAGPRPVRVEGVDGLVHPLGLEAADEPPGVFLLGMGAGAPERFGLDRVRFDPPLAIRDLWVAAWHGAHRSGCARTPPERAGTVEDDGSR